MIKQQVLDHVVPEQLAVVDADETEDGQAGGGEAGDEAGRLLPRPLVPGLARLTSLTPADTDASAISTMATGTKSNWVEKSWLPLERGQRGVGQERRSWPQP